MFRGQLFIQKKLVMLLLLLLLLYISNFIMQQSMAYGKTLMYKNSWLQPIDTKRKFDQPSLGLSPTQRTLSTSEVVAEAETAQLQLEITPRSNRNKMALIKVWPQDLNSTPAIATATTLLDSYNNNALKSLTQLMKYLKQNHKYSLIKENQEEIKKELSTLVFKHDNSEGALITSTTTKPTIRTRANSLWHSEMTESLDGIFIPINFLLDKIKQICDIVKRVIPSQINRSLHDYHSNLKQNDGTSYEQSLAPSRHLSTASTIIDRDKYEKECENSIRSVLSSLLAPLTMPIIATMTARKSALALKELAQARHKHKHKRVKKKFKKFLLPLLLAYKLKFLTLIPLLLGGLVLLVGTTGMAGFFFALFAAVMSLRSTRAFVK